MFLYYSSGTHQDRIQRFLAFADGEQVVLEGLVRVTSVLDFELTLGHKVLHVVFLLDFSLWFFLLFVLGVHFRDVCKIVLILLLLPGVLILAFNFGLAPCLVGEHWHIVILVFLVLYLELWNVSVIAHLVLYDFGHAAWPFLHVDALLEEILGVLQMLSDMLP